MYIAGDEGCLKFVAKVCNTDISSLISPDDE